MATATKTTKTEVQVTLVLNRPEAMVLNSILNNTTGGPDTPIKYAATVMSALAALNLPYVWDLTVGSLELAGGKLAEFERAAL